MLGKHTLAAEAVKSATLSLESVDDVHGGHRLALGVLGVSDGVANHSLQEALQNTAGLFIDEARDTFDSTSASETTNGGLGDTLDVVTQDLAMTLGTSLSESLSTFATSRHDEKLSVDLSEDKKISDAIDDFQLQTLSLLCDSVGADLGGHGPSFPAIFS